MNALIGFLVRQRLTVNLVVFLLCAAGITIMLNTNREVFPNINFDMVSIQTLYPGASPEDSEQLITIPIEKKLRSVSGLERVRAYNIEHVSVLVAYIDPDARNKPRIVQDIKDAVESVDNLPESAERPVVTEFVLDKFPVMDIALTGSDGGDENYRRLRDTAQRLERVIYDLDGVAEVIRMGYYDREFLVEVDPERLKAMNIGINTVINTLRSRNVEMPGGVLRLGEKEILLRTIGKFRTAREVADTVIVANDLGFATRIGDVARVSDTFKEPTVLERFNGRRAVILNVWQREAEDMINTTDRIKAALKEFSAGLDKDIKVEYFNDFSRFVRSRLTSLGNNAVTGFVLLVAILFFLLGLRMSLLVSVTMPVTLMAAFIGMKLAGISLNVISMFALVMVLGMIVDFGIVVSENTYRHLEMGKTRPDAVRAGVGEVFWPVSVTFICICAAFAPLLFVTGLIGKIVWIIPLMIMICLSASWFAAMFILPTYLAGFADPHARHRKRTGYGAAFLAFREKYRFLLAAALRRRYLVLGVLGGILVVSVTVGMLAVGFVFFPAGGGETILVRVRMPQGTMLRATTEAVAPVEKMIRELPKSEIDSFQTRLGIELANVIDPAPGEASHKATIMINLTPEDARKRTADDISDWLREKVAEGKKKGILSEELSLEFRAEEHGPPVGLPVNVEIRGEDLDTLKEIAGEYRKYLESIDGVQDIAIDLEMGKQEYRYRVDERKASRAGLSVSDVSQALHAAFAGTEATSVTLGDDEIAVRVRFPEDYRHREDSLRKVYLENRSGGLVRVSDVASFTAQPGYSMINRLDFHRVIQVQANVDTKKITSLKVNRMLQKQFKEITKRYPGYMVNYGGEEQDRRESMQNLMVLFAFALLLIYCILAVFFGSLSVPLVVMSAVPFAFVGVILGLLTHFQPLSFMGFLGFVSLTGVVVSNTLVLVQFIHYQMERKPLRQALVEAGVMRLRPVLLTSGTTVLALIPTIYGIGGRDAFVAPLALTFGYGLVLATFVTLILIPCLYEISEDIKKGARSLFRKGS